MPTQFIKKMNKTEAGFHILTLLSLADGEIHTAETNVILEFLNDHFNDNIDLIKEQAFLRALPHEEYETHFMETVEHFYTVSTEDERHTITRFAMDVVMADESLGKHENTLITKLYDCWDIE
ncbi:MAG TPA: hypothetical protein DIU05_01400 [Bacteroidetes bacterium]|jgi:uncharacterized tellurite resistance protein B-like protein|nr:hypothetical protein [Bacteroidota bacterium]